MKAQKIIPRLSQLSLVFIVFIGFISHGAPLSPFGSQLLENVSFLSSLNENSLSIQTLPKDWTFERVELSDASTQGNPSTWKVRAPNAFPRLLRLETQNSSTLINEKINAWMKDYSSYGFEVIQRENISSDKILLKLIHRKTEMIIHQALFIRNSDKKSTGIFLTCLKDFKEKDSRSNNEATDFCQEILKQIN